jgi:hypothetical protein
MMFIKNYFFHKKISYFIVLMFIHIFFISFIALAEEDTYILLYDHLYNYGESNSNVLEQYLKLRASGHDVFLVREDKFVKEDYKNDSQIFILASSFDSKKEYQKFLDLKNFQIRLIEKDEYISFKKNSERPPLQIAIDRVYPFSDLNKLMDLAEKMYDKGIRFIVTVMPVYDKYKLPAFDRYISVLKYVSAKGGNLFIHFPVENQDGTYNLESGTGFKKAINEYRKRGLDILGITISRRSLFTGINIFNTLKLPFIMVTESEGKISSDIDTNNVSRILNNYIIINGIEINSFDFFGFFERTYSGGQETVYISLVDGEEKLFNLLNIFNNRKVSIRDFKVEDYSEKIKEFNYQEIEVPGSVKEKSQLDLFKTKEMKKINGKNLSEEKTVDAYSIAGLVKIGTRILFIVIIILLIQLLIGRYYDLKKYIKY